jgi:tetratricopeptide (TPR) repeat protein
MTAQTRKQADIWQDDISLWSHAVKLDPANHYARFRLGDAFMENGFPETAVRAYHSALDLAPSRLWYGINLPRALITLNLFEEALAQVDILLEQGVTEGHKLDLLLLRRAQALVGLDRIEEAKETLQEALDFNPNNQQASLLFQSLAE